MSDGLAVPGAVRTRFAPSPTGFLHIGGARTALFAWAFARHFGGTFVLRIEDTDLERSTPAAVQAILDGMAWLGLTFDEGPFYQMQRMERYQAVLAQMLAAGQVYECWASPEELEAMREAQRQQGLKPRYDGRWRPEERARRGLLPPPDVRPVLRFRNPDDGVVSWHDAVKGPITIANAELDDLIVARPDGTPTYNFCVAVDDWDMRMTHVLRGDDHVNNTPRQINILRALGAPLPVYGHLPMIHGPDGHKLSKRHGAVSVLQFQQEGFLPEAMVNYLARLGWSHGDEELFDRDQLVAWFDGQHLTHAPAQFDLAKLRWVNQHHLKQEADVQLALWLAPRLTQRGITNDAMAKLSLPAVVALFKERASTLEDLADLALMCWFDPTQGDATWQATQAVPQKPAVTDALVDVRQQLSACEWQPAAIAAVLKGCLVTHGLKMPELAIPLRLKVFGRAQTPSLDAMLAVVPQSEVLRRLDAVCGV